ncbi:Uncharacterised protein [Klebsiella pneumoniae]|nr:Uncharacterised protein [Klebsiella pneumoniae]SWZ81362.1 Uncharacterised protein [Klebsiella pneumoniae]
MSVNNKTCLRTVHIADVIHTRHRWKIQRGLSGFNRIFKRAGHIHIHPGGVFQGLNIRFIFNKIKNGRLLLKAAFHTLITSGNSLPPTCRAFQVAAQRVDGTIYIFPLQLQKRFQVLRTVGKLSRLHIGDTINTAQHPVISSQEINFSFPLGNLVNFHRWHSR